VEFPVKCPCVSPLWRSTFFPPSFPSRCAPFVRCFYFNWSSRLCFASFFSAAFFRPMISEFRGSAVPWPAPYPGPRCGSFSFAVGPPNTSFPYPTCDPSSHFCRVRMNLSSISFLSQRSRPPIGVNTSLLWPLARSLRF